ncbi:MAG: ABC-2 family transporter protein [Patescibacteria group bacterium]
MNIKYILPALSHNWTFLVFLIGKIIRFLFFGGFIYFLLNGTKTLAGYDFNQAILFYLTFFLIDTTSQFLFREVYRFRSYIISGSFDLILIKPISPLFRVLMGGADAIDLITLPPLIYLIFHFGSLLDPTILHSTFYILLVVNGLLLSTAFHITVLALGIITLEIDHTVMIFRDLQSLARFPIDIYKQPLQGILTYVLPIGLMMTIPAKALMGLINLTGVLASFGFGILALFISLKFWNFALKKYTSASG